MGNKRRKGWLLFHLQHFAVVVDYGAVEPIGVGGLLRETHHARGSGFYPAVLYVLDVAVDIAHKEQMVQFGPSVHHDAGQLVAEDGELLGSGGGVETGDAVGKHLFKGVLAGAHVHYHGVVAEVAEVADAVEEPEGRRGRVLAHGAVALAEAEGDAVDGAEHGAVAGAVGVVDTEPDDAAQMVGKPVAALCHKAEAGLLGADGTLVDVLFAVHLEVHGAPAVGAVEGACAHVLGHVHGGAFKMVAHQLHHIMGVEFQGRFYPEGEAFGLGIAHGVVLVALHVGGYAVEDGVDAGFTGTEAGEGEGVVGVGKAEVGIGVFGFAVVDGKAVLLGKGDDVVAVDAFHFGVIDIVEVETADGGMGAALAPAGGLLREGGDACLVGVCADVAFRHTACHPHGAFLLSLAGNLEEPHLVGVAEGEGLAPVGIAVGVHKVGHDADGLAAVAGALQGEVDEVSVVNALGVALAEGLDAAPGGLAHGKLVLVDETHYAVGAGGLRDVNLVLEAAVVVEAEHLARGMDAAGVETQLAVARVAVRSVGDHGAAVGGGSAGDEDVGACLALPHGQGKQQQGEEGGFDVHDVKCLMNNVLHGFCEKSHIAKIRN